MSHKQPLSILTGERPLSANSGHSDAGSAGFRIEIVVEGGISHVESGETGARVQWGWSDEVAARETLEQILQWDFERVVIAHGDCIEKGAHAVIRGAWKNPLAD